MMSGSFFGRVMTASGGAMKPRRRLITAGTVALIAGLASVLPASAGQARTVKPAAAPVSCQLSWTKATGNSAYPDTSATYWTVRFPVVSGGYLSVDGTFPHARYMSFNSYQGAAAYDVVEDDILVPNDGAPNPFQGGNPRNNTVTYDMTVAFGPVQSPRAQNTLYSGPAEKPSNEVIYRVYVPDDGQDDTGGVGTPTVTFNAPAGTKLPPQCTDSRPAAAVSSPHAVRAATATNPPTWTKATGNDSYGNLDNAYLSTSISTSLGQVLVIHAEAPTFPATYQGETTFQGGTQLRYWSMCENNPTTTGVIGCSPDYLSNVSGGYYTIVISKTQPTNTGPACGDAWVPWGAVKTGTLLLRNMLPNASFTQAIQNAQPGQLQQDMGAYYPTSAYVATVKDFEALGCPPNLSGLQFG
jgi:hypothetical protein